MPADKLISQEYIDSHLNGYSDSEKTRIEKDEKIVNDIIFETAKKSFGKKLQQVVLVLLKQQR